MFRWYHEGLSAFEHTCLAGHSVFVEVQDQLQAVLRRASDSSALEQLISDSRSRYANMTTEPQQGRDRLLEYNSCRSHVAAAIKQRALDHDAKSTLAYDMERVFDCFGVDSDLHSENCLIIRPTEHMINRFPGLADDGMTITYDRDTALSFEDAQYLTWEHAMVRDAIDLVVSSEFGNTALGAVRYRGAQARTVLLECLFVLEAATVEALQSQRYLPPTTIRVVMDQRGLDHDDKLTHDAINQVAVDVNTAVQVVRAKRNVLTTLLQRCEQHAQQQSGAISKAAHAEAEDPDAGNQSSRGAAAGRPECT
jgi:ATP-dependent helicase HepA